MATQPKIDQLIRAHRAAQERKNRELDETNRIAHANREQLEAECRTHGLAHEGLDDAALRRALLGHLRGRPADERG
jgi:hypothetical protein